MASLVQFLSFPRVGTDRVYEIMFSKFIKNSGNPDPLCKNVFSHDVMDWSLSCVVAFSGHNHSFSLTLYSNFENFAKCY